MLSHMSSHFFSVSFSALLTKSRGPAKPKMAKRLSFAPLPERAMCSNKSFLRRTWKTVSDRVARSRGPKLRLSRKKRETTASAGWLNWRFSLTNSAQASNRALGCIVSIVPLLHTQDRCHARRNFTATDHHATWLLPSLQKFAVPSAWHCQAQRIFRTHDLVQSTLWRTRLVGQTGCHVQRNSDH